MILPTTALKSAAYTCLTSALRTSSACSTVFSEVIQSVPALILRRHMPCWSLMGSTWRIADANASESRLDASDASIAAASPLPKLTLLKWSKPISREFI